MKLSKRDAARPVNLIPEARSDSVYNAVGWAMQSINDALDADDQRGFIDGVMAAKFFLEEALGQIPDAAKKAPPPEQLDLRRRARVRRAK